MSTGKWVLPLLLAAAMAPSSGEVGRILGLPDIKEWIAGQGGAARPSTPGDFDKLVRDEIATRARIFKAAGTKVE